MINGRKNGEIVGNSGCHAGHLKAILASFNELFLVTFQFYTFELN